MCEKRTTELAIACALAVGSAYAAGLQQRAARPDLTRHLRQIAASAHGTLGVHVIHVESGAAAGINDAEWYPMMSVYKLPIAIHALRRAEVHELSRSSLRTR